MDKFFNIKFAELFLKGKNRNTFVNALFKNIKHALCEFNINLFNKRDKFKLEYKQEDEDKIISILKNIPGISYFAICQKCETDIDKICFAADQFDKKIKTFKIEVKRRHKNFLEREEIIAIVAKYLLSKNDLKVDVHHPEMVLTIEIESSNESFVWYKRFDGIGGLPIGINGSCLSLISGGIDSPVASFLMQKRGQIVDYLTFVTEDVTEKTILKIKNLINKVTLNNKIHKARLFIADYTKVQHELMHISNPKYRITLMRRSFYRIAEQLAKIYGFDALVCGDSLGQVASQTIESITTISNACEDMQIFRPLLTYDKLEIIKIAKEIDTYNLSISEHEDVCSMFAPEFPITRPSIKVAKTLENELQLLNYLEKSVIEKIRIIIEV